MFPLLLGLTSLAALVIYNCKITFYRLKSTFPSSLGFATLSSWFCIRSESPENSSAITLACQGKMKLFERGYKSGKWSGSVKDFTFRRLEMKTTAR
jgi:hypothetical protein